jgi:predicted acylesterase/phospholipase RssA
METTYEKTPTFQVGICMAGAVSAGAYTAGVMDYLLEALTAYEKVRGLPGMPKHKIEIPVMGGASAGGMTAILAAAGLQQGITPINEPTQDLLAEHPENILYHSWVDLIAIDTFSKMLETGDIEGKVVSALNCAFIDKIADRVINPQNRSAVKWQKIPEFFPSGLKLFTTLSNLGGFSFDVPFKANDAALDHPYYIQVHQDYACFQLTDEESPVMKDGWMPLNIKTGIGASIAIQAAMATGAFPIGLKARIVERPKQAVNENPLFEKLTRDAFKINIDPYQSLNVDGGMINNEPFDKVRQVLNRRMNQDDPKVDENNATFKSTVIMIAPFPSTKPQNIKLVDKLTSVIGLTLSAMISQMRTKPAHLVDAMKPGCAGQYLIDPTRDFYNIDGTKKTIEGERAIACGALGGFSGFLNKEFRVHDYFLGRHNCKIFLRDYFTIPNDAKEANPIFSTGYEDVKTDRFRSHHDGSWQIIPVIEEINDKLPTLPFSSGHSWPSQKWSAIQKFNTPIKIRIEKLIMNLVSYSFWQRLILWIVTKLALRRMLGNAVLDTVKDELKRWHLINYQNTDYQYQQKSTKSAETLDNEVKQRVLDISLVPGTISELDESSKLSDLGFNSNMCNSLAGRLDAYVKSFKPGVWVNNDEINNDLTIRRVIDFVKTKLGK